MLGQLVAASLPVDLVLGGVDAAGLLEDLGGDLLVGADGTVARGGSEFRAVQGDHADIDQAGLRAEAEHLAEEVAESLLVANAKAGDRGVVGNLVGADHPEGDVLPAAALDPPRRALADRVGVGEQVTIIFGSCAARPWPSAR